jgi:hypothetical protein
LIDWLFLFGSLELYVDMLPSLVPIIFVRAWIKHHRVGSTCILEGGSSAGVTET